MFENVINFFKKIGKKEEKPISSNSKDAAKERLHLVLMQDRANVSADFLELMKQEIIEVIKKYIEVDENAIDVRLTNKENDDGTNGAPALYANIPIINIKNEARKVGQKEVEEKDKNNNQNEKNETKTKEQEEIVEKKNENEKTNQTKIDKNAQTNPETKEQKGVPETKENTTKSTDKQEEKKQSSQQDEPKNTSKQETSKEQSAEEIKPKEETKQKEETNKPIKTKEKVKSEK